MLAGPMVLVVAVVVVTTSPSKANKEGQLSDDDGGSSGYKNSSGYKLQLQVLRTGIFANRRLGCNTDNYCACPLAFRQQACSQKTGLPPAGHGFATSYRR